MPSKGYSYKSQSVTCCLLYKYNKGETLQNLGAAFIWHLQGLNTAYYCVLAHRPCFTESSTRGGSLTSGEKAKPELVANHIGICSIRSCGGNVSIPASSSPLLSTHPFQLPEPNAALTQCVSKHRRAAGLRTLCHVISRRHTKRFCDLKIMTFDFGQYPECCQSVTTPVSPLHLDS